MAGYDTNLALTLIYSTSRFNYSRRPCSISLTTYTEYNIIPGNVIQDEFPRTGIIRMGGDPYQKVAHRVKYTRSNGGIIIISPPLNMVMTGWGVSGRFFLV